METTKTISTKKIKIIFWIFTIWMSLGMVSSAIVQLMKTKEEVDMFTHLGYPAYFMNIIAIWKILGVITILTPKFSPILKEWAYAGFFFVMSGAAISHIVLGDSMKEIFPALLLLTLTIVSWYYNRKITSINQ